MILDETEVPLDSIPITQMLKNELALVRATELAPKGPPPFVPPMKIKRMKIPHDFWTQP